MNFIKDELKLRETVATALTHLLRLGVPIEGAGSDSNIIVSPEGKFILSNTLVSPEGQPVVNEREISFDQISIAIDPEKRG